MTDPHPYHALTVHIRDERGNEHLRVRLADDMPGCIEIVELDAAEKEIATVLVDPAHVPSLVRALRIIQRESLRVEREGA